MSVLRGWRPEDHYYGGEEPEVLIVVSQHLAAGHLHDAMAVHQLGEEEALVRRVCPILEQEADIALQFLVVVLLFVM